MRFFRLQPIRLDLGDVVVQIVAVALGVFLGFGATTWNERLHQEALLRETVGNIADELRSNQGGMRQVMPQHARAAAALARLAASPRPVTLGEMRAVLRHTPPGGVNVPLAIAWQIAQSDQGLTLLPYQDRYDLGWVYELQAVFFQRETFLQNSLLALAPSPGGNFSLEVLDLANQAQAVVSTERQLDDLYTAAIKRLRV